MPGRFVRRTILVSIACWTLAAQGADSPAPVVRSAAQLEAVLSSRQPSPLDAFTPYGKRRFLQSLLWGERGLGSFGTASLERELEPRQIAAVLAFIDAEAYLPGITRNLAGSPVRLPAPTADTQARFDQFQRFSAEEDRRRNASDLATTTADGARLESRYRALFGDRLSAQHLRELPTGDLQAYFDAAVLAADGRPDSVAARHLGLLHEELRVRGIDTRRTFDASVLRQLLQGRKFEEARAFVSGKPHLADTAIPTVHDPLGAAYRGRSVYRYDAQAGTLTREPLPPAAGTEFVMLVNGGCQFSANALVALREDAELRTRLQGAGLTLIVPPRAPIDLDFVREWNEANPAIPMRIPYSVEEWSAVDFLNVPRFFLLNNGKVVRQVTGWPAQGNKAALFALLDGTAN